VAPRASVPGWFKSTLLLLIVLLLCAVMSCVCRVVAGDVEDGKGIGIGSKAEDHNRFPTG